MATLGAQLRALAHYRPAQIYHRLRTRLRQRLVSARPTRLQRRLRRLAAQPPPTRALRFPEGLEAFLTDPDVAPADGRDALAQGRFRFLGREVALGFPPDWARGTREAPSHLWRMNLHYHRFLLDTVAHALRAPARAEEAFGAAARVLEDWMARCPPGAYRAWSDAWQSYAVSTRILHAWCARLALEAFRGANAGRLRRALDGMASANAAFLESWLEWDVLGNHLLRNASALVAAGRWFGGPLGERWWRTGRALLLDQLALQILPDGFHEERTPLYQSLILEDLLLVGAFPEPDAELLQWASRLLAALRSVLHPDGHFALFNDAAFGVAAPPWTLERLARDVGAAAALGRAGDLPHAGYFRFEEGDHVLIVDAGPLGPDHLPAHAHCDALSFEYSFAGRRVVVDTGVDRYEPGPERDYQRSTAAHSTLQVDGLEQAECFGSFRMGRRARVRGRRLDWRTVEGEHDGFGGIGLHRRRVEWLGAAGFRWADRLETTSGRPVHVRVALVPEARAAAADGAFEFACPAGHRFRLELPRGSELVLEPGLYCSRFGDARARVIAATRTTGRSELRFRLAPA